MRNYKFYVKSFQIDAKRLCCNLNRAFSLRLKLTFDDVCIFRQSDFKDRSINRRVFLQI